MGNCCCNLNSVFCKAYKKYYDTLEVNGEISKTETDNLIIIGYLRKLLMDVRYLPYQYLIMKALRCIANNSCLIDGSSLYNRGRRPKKNQVCNV